MSETRYDWLVDRQPTQTRYTGLGDVTGSIEVSMEFKTTGPAEELGTMAIPFVDMATDRTLLRGEPSIYKNNLFAEVLSFVPDKLLKFVERPVVQFPVELFPAPFLHTDLRKIFECEHGIRRPNNLLRDVVIGISHKPSFSTGHFTESLFGGSSAFGLQFGSEIRVLSSRILHGPGIKKCVIRTHCDVHDPPVNAEDVQIRNEIGGSGFDLHMQEEPVIVAMQRQRGRFDQPPGISLIIIRDKKCRSDSSPAGCKSGIPGFEIQANNPGIVSHCRELFTERLTLTFHRLKRFASTIPGALYQRGREIRNRFPDILISRFVVEHLARRVVFETPRGTGVEGHCVIFHGFQERSTTIRRYIKSQLDSPNHIHMFDIIVEISIGGDADALPPHLKRWGLRAAFR